MSDQNESAAQGDSAPEQQAQPPAFEVPAPPPATTPYQAPAPAAFTPADVPPAPSAASVVPAKPTLSPELVKTLLRGLSTAGIAVGVLLIAGALLALLVGVSFADSVRNVGLGLPVDVFGALEFDGTHPIFLVFTLAGLILGGGLDAGITMSSSFFGESGSGQQVSLSVSLFPLLFLVLVLGVVLWWSIRQARRAPVKSLLEKVILSAVIGLVTSLVILALALIFSYRFGVTIPMIGDVDGHFTASGIRIVLWGTILIGLTVFLGTHLGSRADAGGNWLRVISGGIASLPRGARETLAYGSGLAIVFGLGAVIMTAITGIESGVGSSVLMGIAGIFNIAPFVAAVGHLGGVSANAGALTAAFSGDSGSSDVITLFSPGNGLQWLFFVAALLFSIFIAVWLGVRRPRVAGVDLRTAWQFPLFAIVGWVLLSLLFYSFSMSLTLDIPGMSVPFTGGESAGFTIGIVWWSFLVLLLWILAIEAGAQFLPSVLYGLSPQVLSVVGGRSATQRWLEGPAVSQAPFAAPARGYPGADGAPAPYVVPAPGAPAPAGTHGFAAPSAFAVPAPGGGVIAPPASDGIAPPSAGAALPAPKPLSPRAKKTLIWSAAAVVGIGLLIAAAAITVGVINSSRNPESAAKAYLQYLADGNAEAAGALADPNIPTDERAYLTNEVLQGAKERISDFTVERQAPDYNQDEVYLNVTYKLDGVTYETMLTAEKGDPDWLFLDTWKLTSALTTQVTLTVSGTGDVALSGAPVAYDADQTSYATEQLSVYPGVYEFTGAAGEFFEAAPVEVTAAEYSPDSSVMIEFRATSALTKNVEGQLKSLIDECVKRTEAAPEGCPFRAYVYDDAPVTWSVVEYPTAEVDERGIRFTADGGEVKGTYTRTLYDGEQREEETTDSLYLYGDIVIEDGEVTLEY